MRTQLMDRVAKATGDTGDHENKLLLEMVEQAITAGPDIELPEWVEAELNALSAEWEEVKSNKKKRKKPKKVLAASEGAGPKC